MLYANKLHDLGGSLRVWLAETGAGSAMFNTTNVVSNGRSFALFNVDTIEYAVPNELVYVEYIGGGNYGNVM